MRRIVILLSALLLLGGACLAAETTVNNDLYGPAGNFIGTVTSDGQFVPFRTDPGGQPLDANDASLIDRNESDTPQAAFPDASTLSEFNDYTVDRLTSSATFTYTPQSSFEIVGRSSRDYYLSNGTSWSSGAGSFTYGSMTYRSCSRQGVTLLYQFDAPGLILQTTDYNAGDHAAHFRLEAFGPLVLTATEGSTVAKLSGLAEIVMDELPPNCTHLQYHMLSSPVGSIIPFDVTYTLSGGQTFTENTFEQQFNYRAAANIDFLNVYQGVELDYITIFGPAVVPSESYVSYTAIGVYVNGSVSDFTDGVTWSVEGSQAVTVSADGQVITGQIAEQTEFVLRASCSDGTVSQKAVTVIPRTAHRNTGDWSMYQGNSRHNGYLPAMLWPEQFDLLWQVTMPSSGLDRITAADGKIFTSTMGRLDVVDGLTGSRLWSKTSHHRHGSFPSYANGIVYKQWGNHGNDTYLEAYDADSGEVVFKAPHAAQWENYYAPTIYEGRVYVNGGYYGGSYCFDALNGTKHWFRSLAQYDEWTPAVDADYAYAYVGGILSVLNKQTGDSVFRITDPGFSWHGWSMKLAPVLGGNHNALVIQNGRLISFDLVNRQIGFQRSGSYSGQPSVADSVIYAVNGGNIEAIDEVTGQLLWTYDAADNFLGEMIVTNSHILSRTGSKTYVIAIEDQKVQWEYPVTGYMAMSDDRLYVASSNGTLTAFSMPNLTSNQIVGFEIKGPNSIDEYAVTGFGAAVRYEGGYEWFVTSKANWSVVCQPEGAATIDAFGRVRTRDKDGTVTIKATFVTGDQTVSAEKTVAIVHPVTAYYVNGATGDDMSFGITEAQPFASIQRAINEAWDGDTIFVEGGTYEEVIDFLGKRIMVKAVNDAVTLAGPSPAPLESSLPDGTSVFQAAEQSPQTFACVIFDRNETEESVLENFIVTGVFAGIYCGSGSPTIHNVTSVRNGYGLAVWGQGDPKVSNSIFWGNSIADCYGGLVTYSCVQRGAAGESNIVEDPLFANFADGDYHLRSERGRYNPTLSQWVLDDVTSPCIAAGDPASDDSLERMPNGGRINMGAYGGLYKASMKDWPLPADINCDGTVNMTDLSALAESWLLKTK